MNGKKIIELAFVMSVLTMFSSCLTSIYGREDKIKKIILSPNENII